MKKLLSVVIIAKNEEKRITSCTQHINFADEIIVVDNGSTDDTAKLAKSNGAIVVPYEGTDFSEARNIGLKNAHNDWVLFLDADEEITQELKKEILYNIKLNNAKAYRVRRNTYFLERQWPYQDSVERLFLRTELAGWKGKLHESPVYHGAIYTLNNPLIHKTHRTLEEMVQKTNAWSDIEAQLRQESHHPPVVWWRLLRVMWTGFIRSYVRQGGWRAGTVGLIESIYQAFSMFITYAKLWEIQQKKK